MKPLELSVTRGVSRQEIPDGPWKRIEFTVKLSLDAEDDLDVVQRSVSSRVESWLQGGPEEGPPPPGSEAPASETPPVWRQQKDSGEWGLLEDAPVSLREKLRLAGAKADDEAYHYRSWKTADGSLRVSRYRRKGR